MTVRAGTSRRRPGPARRSGGFTLTELLTVLFIIGLLAGLLLGAVMVVRRRVGRSNTRNMLTAISAAIEHYSQDWGDFPPGAGGTEGSEELLAALRSDRFEGPYLRGEYPPCQDTDGDRREELVDHWRRPIGYTHHRNYSGEPNADGYRLRSFGLDGEPDTEDDVVNWKQ
jgi:general secretion pathway protein G